MISLKEINLLDKEVTKKFFPDILASERKYITLSNHIHVSDPCYSKDVRCRHEITNIAPGEYMVGVLYNKNGRVTELDVIHTCKFDLRKSFSKKPYTNVGVDSGKCGVFCDSIYPQGESTGEYGEPGFYQECCDATMQGYDDMQRAFNLLREAKDRIKGLKEEYKSVMDMINKEPKVNTGLTFKQFKESKLQQLYYNISEIKKIIAKDITYPMYGIIQGKGIVSSSGRGDGSYNVYVQEQDGEVTGILIRYI